jgi:predicted O-methyltransferase YrrM
MNRTAEPYLRVTELANAFVISRMLHVAMSLDLFTRLANQDKTAAQLATLVDVDAHAIEVLLDALTAEGFLQKNNGRYFDTPTSQTYLAREGPKYLGHAIRSIADQWDMWGKLETALRRGRAVGKRAEASGDQEAIENAVRGQHERALASGDARYLSKAIPLRKCRKLLHLGGGCGTYASMFCRANRSLQATVLDLPATLKATRKILRRFDTSKRVSTLSGDYRTPGKVRGGPFDVVLLTELLQYEDPQTNAAILEKAHDALVPGGLLIIKEQLLSADHTQPLHAALLSLEMLLTSQGRAWSFAEIAPWLEKSGFVDAVEVPMEPPMAASLVLALRTGKPAVAVLPKPAAKVEAPAPEAMADGAGKPVVATQTAPKKASSPRTRNAASPPRASKSATGAKSRSSTRSTSARRSRSG